MARLLGILVVGATALGGLPAPAPGATKGAGSWTLLLEHREPAAGVGAGLAVLVLSFIFRRLLRRRRLEVENRRERLRTGLAAAGAAPPDPLIPLLRRAQAALRRAQMDLADAGDIDQAAAVLDERMRLERILRSLAVQPVAFDSAALLLGLGGPQAGLPDTSLAEPVAEEVLRRATRVELDARRLPRDLSPALEALRKSSRRLRAAVEEAFAGIE